MGLAAGHRTVVEEVRTRAHDALDAWLDQLEADTTADAPTLREISERFIQTRLTLLGSCREAVIRRRYAADLQQTDGVCSCARRLGRRRLHPREIPTLQGTFTRPHPWC